MDTAADVHVSPIVYTPAAQTLQVREPKQGLVVRGQRRVISLDEEGFLLPEFLEKRLCLDGRDETFKEATGAVEVQRGRRSTGCLHLHLLRSRPLLLPIPCKHKCRSKKEMIQKQSKFEQTQDKIKPGLSLRISRNRICCFGVQSRALVDAGCQGGTFQDLH